MADSGSRPLKLTQIAGYILGDSLQWTHVATYSGVLVFFGSFLILISRMLQAKRMGTWKV